MKRYVLLTAVLLGLTLAGTAGARGAGPRHRLTTRPIRA